MYLLPHFIYDKVWQMFANAWSNDSHTYSTLIWKAEVNISATVQYFMIIVVDRPWIVQRSSLIFRSQYIVLHFPFVRLGLKFCIYICTCKFILHQGRGIQCFKEVHVYSLVRFYTCTCTSPYWNMTLFKVHIWVIKICELWLIIRL